MVESTMQPPASPAFAQFKSRLRDDLETLKREERFYTPNLLSSAQGPRITMNGRSYINLCANNYLGFAQDPIIIAAAHEALDKYGFGLGAGRVVCSMTLHQQLEERLAAYKGREAALVCQTGYDTNLAALSVLAGEEDAIISDAMNHASIIDGCRLTHAKRHTYPHADLDALEACLRETQDARSRIIITDGVFSMDGDLAPLPEIATLADRYAALVYVDDAHGDGVLGRTGRGIVEHFSLEGRIAFEIGTLSKALGGVGGFVASDQEVIQTLYQRSRPFMFSTGHLPPMVAAGLIAALDLLQAQPERLTRLWANAGALREGFQRLGFNTGASATPIIPVIVGEAAQAMALGRELRNEGVYVQAFAFPVVPKGAARVRCIVSAAHSQADIEEVLQAFATVGRKLRLI
jgi:glycine C-acetyltransferase